MPELPATVYAPIAGALVAALGLVWRELLKVQAQRARERRDEADRYDALVHDVLGRDEDCRP